MVVCGAHTVAKFLGIWLLGREKFNSANSVNCEAIESLKNDT